MVALKRREGGGVRLRWYRDKTDSVMNTASYAAAAADAARRGAGKAAKKDKQTFEEGRKEEGGISDTCRITGEPS